MGSSIYRRESDKRWVGSISLGKDINGKRKRKNVYGDTKKEVEDKINTILYEIRMGEYIEPSKDTLIGFLKNYHKVCAGYDMWNKNSVKPKDSTWEQTTAELYKLYIDVHFAPYFGNMKIVDVKPLVLDSFYNFKMTSERKYFVTVKGKPKEKTAKPLSLNSTRKLNSFLSSAFDYAVFNAIIKNNPTKGIKLGKKTKYLPNVYNEDQFFHLLEYVAGTDDEIPIVLGGGCGLRRAEIFGLYWRNIDFNTGYIEIERTSVRFDKTIEKDPKNESSRRTFKAPEYVLEILSRYKKITRGKQGERVITRWKPGSYSERFGKLLKQFKLPHVRLHDLRHYNAVIMCKYGVSDKVAAERLGHSQVSTLKNIYQHVLKDMDQTAADEIDIMFAKKKEREEKKSNFKIAK